MQYRLFPSQNVTARSFGDEIVAAHFLSGRYFSMLGSAAQIWEGLLAGAALERVIAELTVFTDAGPGEFEEAARAFVNDLLEERLIMASERSADESWKPAPPAEGRYALPALERYTDMEDLLRLDPVHDVDDMGWPLAAGEEGARVPTRSD
jgi:hypothetical protein